MAAAAMLMGAKSELVGYPCEDVAPTLVRRSAPALLTSLMLSVAIVTIFYGLLSSAVMQAVDDYFVRKSAAIREPVPAMAVQFQLEQIARADALDEEIH